MTSMVRDLTKKAARTASSDEASTANAENGSVSDHPTYSGSGSNRDEFNEDSGNDGETDPVGEFS